MGGGQGKIMGKNEDNSNWTTIKKEKGMEWQKFLIFTTFTLEILILVPCRMSKISIVNLHCF